MAAIAGSGPVNIPMRSAGWFNPNHRYFDPIYSTTIPMDWKEFCSVVDELNATMSDAFPAWKLMPFPLLVVAGFVAFAAGGFLMVGGVEDFEGPPPFAMLLIALGFTLFGCGSVGGGCACMARSTSSISALRGKLSELNARYAGRGIDFQLVETKRLQETYHDGHWRLRTVSEYTLVVQRLQPAVQQVMPPMAIGVPMEAGAV